ncbi:hypothetical protein SCHPADRAFT_997593 [Schizopora paradoxa]|uniref:Uncharacterized protein n=1 Tax=Schizopora paradoxa TaxID=27342 RepID=A0A0H2RUP2_9AGAM|nr:hypothetical protein SCHPADRAFT_997593 [Schizopora paradoxa]
MARGHGCSAKTSSMVQNLAPELLHQIFLHCAPSKLTPNVFSTAPLNVSLVCRSWRTTALDRPDLWASIHLSNADFDHWLETYPRHRLLLYRKLSAMWRFWIMRSRRVPLDIVLELRVDPMDSEPVVYAARDIYSIVFGNESRWRSFAVDFQNMIVGSDGKFTPKENPLPRIATTNYGATLLASAVPLDITSCQILECLSLRSAVRIPPISFDMPRLRVVRARTINALGLITLIQHTPNLEILEVSECIIGHSIAQDTSSSEISLPVLTDLVLRLRKFIDAETFDHGDFGDLIRRFHCPSLINLRVYARSSDDICTPLYAMFARSHPPLQRFSLSTMVSYEEPAPRTISAFEDVLKLIPSLVYLEVEGYLAVRKEIIKSLAKYRPDKKGLLPLITHTVAFYSNRYFQFLKMGNGEETKFPGDPDERE